ncbi:hypothetical protein RND71_043622 [Anisodus tanguticus]|uniref:AAA+ ATPase domain-containing protein n=1 Tax=Anisodus tanguticus TaxID=243964 RepID=A0AAE1QSK5_9SOLA|nr:hypothetical protein RND71_043622 [Anisodus tanguticus]
MSWIFGRNNPVPDYSKLDMSGMDGSDDKKNNNQKSQDKKSNNNNNQFQLPSEYAFGSLNLEKAAKAARELEKSPLAKQILELSKEQEVTKQKDIHSKMKEYEVAVEQAKIEQKRIDHEERRKNMQEEGRIAQQKAQYEDQLARKRYEDQLSQQKRTNEEILRKQEESILKQEQLKRKSIEYEAELKLKNSLKEIETKYKAKGKMDKENHEINLEKIKLNAAESRRTKLESIKSFGEMFGTGFKSFITDKEKVKTTVLGITLTAAGIYTAKHSIGILGRTIESRISKPSLVRETSRLNINDVLKHPILTAKKYLIKEKGEVLSDVVLAPELEEKLRDISIGAFNTKKNKGFFCNYLFYGPPGTGKTLVAKKLVSHSNMDYAILSGGDIKPLGPEAVTSIHKLFEWASTSRKGLLLFIDEADAFLRERNSTQMSEDLRSSLNAFLQRTGTPSDSFMLILASNTPEQFDWAIKDRIDEDIMFDLPSRKERERLVRLYFDKFILTPASKAQSRLKVDNFDYDKACSKVAEMTEGFSARQIFKLANAWQKATYITIEGIMTENLLMKTVDNFLENQKKNQLWTLARKNPK